MVQVNVLIPTCVIRKLPCFLVFVLESYVCKKHAFTSNHGQMPQAALARKSFGDKLRCLSNEDPDVRRAKASSGMEDAMWSWHDESRTLNRELVWVVKWEPGPGSGTRLSRLSRAAPRVSRGECGLAPLLHEGNKVCWHAACVSVKSARRSLMGRKG